MNGSVNFMVLVILLAFTGCTQQTQEEEIQTLIQDLGRDTPSLRWMRTTPREAAKKKLGKMGKDVVPALVRALSQADSSVQSGVTDTLASIGKDAVPAMTQLLKELIIQKVINQMFELIGLNLLEILFLKNYYIYDFL